MKSDTAAIPLRQPDSVDDPLTEIARKGARRMLAAALKAEAEADAFVSQFSDEQLPDGRKRLVRHGQGPGTNDPDGDRSAGRAAPEGA